MRSRFLKLMAAVLALNCVVPALGVETPVSSQGSSPAYYISPGYESRLQITVHIWGEVHKPGLYVVPDNTDLVTLLSYAGGPTKNARVSSVKLIRTTEGSDQVEEIDFKDYISHGNPDATLVLQPGDTVVVPGSVWYAMGRFFGFLTQVAIVASTANVIFFSQ